MRSRWRRGSGRRPPCRAGSRNRHGVRRSRSRGKVVARRMLGSRPSCISSRSSPMAKPPCGGMPWRKASRYPAKGSGGKPGPRERGQVVRVPVQALAAGHQLGAAEEQVERVRVLGAGRIRVGVERPLAHRIAGDEQEVAAVGLLRPCAERPLVRGDRSGSPRLSTPVTLQDQLLGLDEVQVRDAGRHGRQLDLEQRQLGRVLLAQVGRRSRPAPRAAPPSRRSGRG